MKASNEKKVKEYFSKIASLYLDAQKLGDQNSYAEALALTIAFTAMYTTNPEFYIERISEDALEFHNDKKTKFDFNSKDLKR